LSAQLLLSHGAAAQPALRCSSRAATTTAGAPTCAKATFWSKAIAKNETITPEGAVSFFGESHRLPEKRKPDKKLIQRFGQN